MFLIDSRGQAAQQGALRWAVQGGGHELPMKHAEERLRLVERLSKGLGYGEAFLAGGRCRGAVR
ncbi:MAG: hypothetical protein QXI60_03880 [Thermofilaceae archaeon]